MPEPISTKSIKEITEQIYYRFHEDNATCAVCDQIVRVSQAQLLTAKQLPKKFFEVLQTPTTVPVLHPTLVEQYNISQFFPEEPQFNNVLLSPRGVLHHNPSCKKPESCRCKPKLYICERANCIQNLKIGKLPKFSIANGNWVGQLPEEISNMTYGSRVLMRPVQTFGRIVAFGGTAGPGGSRLTGHVYSTKLKTALVVKKVPLIPSQAPVRVLVVTPFSSDESALEQGKRAAIKADYIVEPTKIRALHQFWKDVDNEIMKDISFDENTFENLPNNDASPDVFLVERIEANRTENDSQDGLGGPSLLRSAEEEIEAPTVSCTVTIGNSENNGTEHEQILRVLPSFPSSNTYVVRPNQEFVSDSDPKYLETHYPDLFPFARGGFGEERKVRISKKALIAHYANLSTRQYQKIDFVLPVYDMIARMNATNMAVVRAKLPSRFLDADGTFMRRGEAYGKVELEDLRKAAAYQNECIRNKIAGRRMPRIPESTNGLAASFFRDITLSNHIVEHSQAAAQRNRQEVYAAHANNGKAHIWLTVSPDDAKCWKVCWFALGPCQSRPFKNQIPVGTKRFQILAEHPVAAALHFERIMDIIIEEIIGWCKEKGLPYKRGGLFGVPKAWLRVIEEQSRLTLHTHILIWLYGHGDIEGQLDSALKQDNEEFRANLGISQVVILI